MKRSVGRDYAKVIELLDESLKPLDLQVKVVPEEGESMKDLSRTELRRQGSSSVSEAT